jgi:hypothetical protein
MMEMSCFDMAHCFREIIKRFYKQTMCKSAISSTESVPDGLIDLNYAQPSFAEKNNENAK